VYNELCPQRTADTRRSSKTSWSKHYTCCKLQANLASWPQICRTTSLCRCQQLTRVPHPSVPRSHPKSADGHNLRALLERRRSVVWYRPWLNSSCFYAKRGSIRSIPEVSLQKAISVIEDSGAVHSLVILPPDSDDSRIDSDVEEVPDILNEDVPPFERWKSTCFHQIGTSGLISRISEFS
jgi:hypothetical protein